MSQPNQEPALADAIADLAKSAQRIVEERVELFRIEVRNDLRSIIRASALGAGGVVAMGVAVGMAAGSLVWTLALWMPFGAALGITAVLTGTAGVILTRMARARLPHHEKSDADKPQVLPAIIEERRQLRSTHDVEAST